MPARLPKTRHDAAITRLVAEGSILNEICKEIGEGPQFVYARLHRLGLPPLPSKGERLLADVTKLAAQGLTLVEISDAVGRCYDHVRKVASDAGIAVAPAERPIQEPKFDHSEAVARVRSGETLASVAERYGVTRQRISQLTQRAGLSLRRGPKSAVRRAASQTSDARSV